MAYHRQPLFPFLVSVQSRADPSYINTKILNIFLMQSRNCVQLCENTFYAHWNSLTKYYHCKSFCIQLLQYAHTLVKYRLVTLNQVLMH